MTDEPITEEVPTSGPGQVDVLSAKCMTVEKPPRGSPESAAWFRDALAALGETQSSLARLMKRKGDDRQPNTILRTIQRMATGEARVSGEMRVILTMMQRAKNRGEKRSAEKAAARDDQPTV